MTPEQVTRAHNAVRQIEEMDRAMVNLGDSLAKCPGKYGRDARHALGPNRLGKFADERLGKVLLCALINDLLDRREALVKAHPCVSFAAPPCPRQVLPCEEER